MNLLILHLTSLWAILAALVGFLSARLFIRLFPTEGFSPRASLLAGMFLSWSGAAIHRGWYVIARLYGFPDRMAIHMIVVLAGVMAISGALIHLHSFLSPERKNLTWLISVVASLMVSVMIALDVFDISPIYP